jgi:hypothetical protein
MIDMPTRVLIADDQDDVRGAFRLILDAQPDMTVIGEAADGATAVELAHRLHPDVVLADIRMPSGSSSSPPSTWTSTSTPPCTTAPAAFSSNAQDPPCSPKPSELPWPATPSSAPKSPSGSCATSPPHQPRPATSQLARLPDSGHGT